MCGFSRNCFDRELLDRCLVCNFFSHRASLCLPCKVGEFLCQSGEEESIIKKFNDAECVLCTWGTRWCAAWYLVIYRKVEDSCFVAMYEVTALSSM